MMKNTIVVLGVALLMTGVVLAISGASVTSYYQLPRWDGASPGSLTIEGGNITNANLSSGSLTDRWGAFFGNVSGSIVLQDNASSTLYTWTVSTNPTGEVCISQGNAFGFATAAATVAGDVDFVWTHANAADGANNTLTQTGCALTFTQGAVGSTVYADHTVSTFNTCAINDGSTATKANFAFCGVMQPSGTAYNGQTVNYELMVPVTAGTGVETYYFYVELN